MGLPEERARLLSILRWRTTMRFVLPIRRWYYDPNDWRNMFNPLRTRRDYDSSGRRTVLVEELPDGIE